MFEFLVDDDKGLKQLLGATRRVAVLGMKTEAHTSSLRFTCLRTWTVCGLEVVPVPVYYPEVSTIWERRCTAASWRCRDRSTS